MNYYRLYSLDLNDDHIIDFRDFKAINDVAAIVEAGPPHGGVSRELWNRDRRVLELAL